MLCMLCIWQETVLFYFIRIRNHATLDIDNNVIIVQIYVINSFHWGKLLSSKEFVQNCRNRYSRFTQWRLRLSSAALKILILQRTYMISSNFTALAHCEYSLWTDNYPDCQFRGGNTLPKIYCLTRSILQVTNRFTILIFLLYFWCYISRKKAGVVIRM